jgi:caffeoyl-CoA O-methyltransferase
LADNRLFINEGFRIFHSIFAKTRVLELIPENVSAYAARFTTPDDDLLNEIAVSTSLQHPHAHMLSGHLQGQLLGQISRMINPERILEIGTFVGYSALCLAKGLSAKGKLHTIELRPDDAATAQRYFDKSGYKDQLIIHTGEALSIIETLNESWDLVFIDADKINYVSYYEAVLPAVKKGGWILADNVLFHGEVLQEELKGKNAKAIDAFNRHVASDERVEQVLLTVRDGLLLIHKK